MAENKYGWRRGDLNGTPYVANEDDPADQLGDTLSVDPQGPGPATFRAEQSDGSDLETRVLAHEKILQTLIAHTAETQPKLLERLYDAFSMPMQMARKEHHQADTDFHAARFFRAAVPPQKNPVQQAPEPVPDSQ